MPYVTVGIKEKEEEVKKKKKKNAEKIILQQTVEISSSLIIYKACFKNAKVHLGTPETNYYIFGNVSDSKYLST